MERASGAGVAGVDSLLRKSNAASDLCLPSHPTSVGPAPPPLRTAYPADVGGSADPTYAFCGTPIRCIVNVYSR